MLIMMNEDRKSKWGWYAPLMMSLLFYAVIMGIVLLFSGCERRELYVFSDEYHNVFLDVDWSDYATEFSGEDKPDGMTVWFYPETGASARPRTTPKVDHYDDIYLQRGLYQGLLINYSPEEFSKQQFFGMDHLETARVQAVKSEWQPQRFDSVYAQLDVKTDFIPYTRLYGDSCWSKELPSRESTGYYTLTAAPEYMAADTLKDMDIKGGEYGDYIPWDGCNDYQSSLTEQGFFSMPEPIVQQLRVRIFVRGFQNINFGYPGAVTATIAGLSDGYNFATSQNAENPCLMSLDKWSYEVVKDVSGYKVDTLGYIIATINTFGLRPSTVNGWKSVHTGEERQTVIDAYGHERGVNDSIWWVESREEELRLNLRFVLRDRSTVVEYSYEVGNQVLWEEDRHLLRIDLLEEFPVLPNVDPYNGAGFDAEVEPWVDGPTADVEF